MSSNIPNTQTTSENFLPPRDSSSVGSGINQTSEVVVIYNPALTGNTSNSTPDDGPVLSKRRRTEDSSSLPPQLLSDLKGLVDNIAKEMKDLRKCGLAVLHYEEYAKGNSFPKDIDIDVKFGNPYPTAVSRHASTSLECLAQKEKLIWDKAKAEIVALRLETLKETQTQVGYVISEMRDPAYFESKIDIPSSTSIEAARQAFETMASLKITEMENLFKEQTKAFEARQQKRLQKQQKQQEKASAMETDDQQDSEPSLEDMLKRLTEAMSVLQKEVSSIKRERSRHAPKNFNAPERKGHGKPVHQQTREDNIPSRQRRPNQNDRPQSYKDALNRPYQRTPQPHRQQRVQGRGDNQDGQWTTVNRKRFNRDKTDKKKQGQNPKMNQKSKQQQQKNQSVPTTGNGNRGKR